MEQLFAHIEQLKQQIANLNQENAHYNKEKKTTSLLPGPVTRSRNNSPALSESKRGRPQKHREPPAAECRSPPSKKSTSRRYEENTRVSDEEIEKTEAPPRRPFR